MTMATTTTDTDQDLGIDVDDPGFDDGGGSSCDWDDYICDEDPEYYMVWFCDDPDCRLRHRHDFCLRHYALRLIMILDHISVCPAYRDAKTPEERRKVTMGHIAAWGRLGD